MHCRNCDYSLWNLKARHCPECGVEFRPSEFEYHINSVRFCCPHCDQSYYGTGERGHLVPRRFQCVSCQQVIDMDEMVLRPADGVAEAQTVIDDMPWARRQTNGWLRSWWQTSWKGMVAPVRLAQSLSPSSTVGSAWLYLAVTLFICGVVGGSLPLAVMALFMAISGNSSDALEMVLFAVGFPVGNVLANLVSVALWGLTAHGILRLTGGCNRTIGATYQSLCYTAGPNIFTAVPCIGFYCLQMVAGIWWIVSGILMVAGAQGVHAGRATLAVLAFPVTATLLVFGLYFGIIFYAFNAGMNTTTTWQNTAAYTPHGETMTMTDAILGWARAHNGDLPDHALALINDGQLTEEDYLAIDSYTFAEDVALGAMTLDSFTWESEDVRAKVIEAALADQPDDVIAHRFGDFVFTYHGIDPRSSDAGLWLVLLIHDPQANAPEDMNSTIHVGKVGRVIAQFPASELAEQVRMQNERRAVAGLPPLPEDLAGITQDEPATP